MKKFKYKKPSKKQILKWEREEYKTLIKHPAIELLRFLPHTKEYKLVCLLQEVLEEVFDQAYDAGMEDAQMLREREANER